MPCNRLLPFLDCTPTCFAPLTKSYCGFPLRVGAAPPCFVTKFYCLPWPAGKSDIFTCFILILVPLPWEVFAAAAPCPLAVLWLVREASRDCEVCEIVVLSICVF